MDKKNVGRNTMLTMTKGKVDQQDGAKLLRFEARGEPKKESARWARDYFAELLQTAAARRFAELSRRATLRIEKPKLKATAVDPLDGIVVTKEYKRVRTLLEDDHPIVFVTGAAGTGKTTLIQYLRNTLDMNLPVLAPTGVAALNAGRVTIHSFSFSAENPRGARYQARL